MKLYKIKEEFKVLFYISNELRDSEQLLVTWNSHGVTSEALEALEGVPSRIELGYLYNGESKMNLRKRNNEFFTDQEKDLCEKAINKELFDFETAVDFMKWNDPTMEFCEFDVFENTFKQYLKLNK